MNQPSIPNAPSLTGLSEEEVVRQRALHGKNELIRQRSGLMDNIRSVVAEPMFVLLLVACLIYFVLQDLAEAFAMLVALLFVAGIDVFQNFRSQRAIKALGKITNARARVVRASVVSEIEMEELVVDDVVICEEGTIIPADAIILSANDFAVNEAIITGESAAVERMAGEQILQGTLVVRGYCQAQVRAIGKFTTLAGIGEMVATVGKEKTPLQRKVANFVRVMVLAGSVAFLFVWIYNWWESGSWLHGLLHGLTMAMSVLPEEIPVALSSFMALGAYRLLQFGVIARSPKTVETLGSATVICLDKTGTLTQNLMQVAVTCDMINDVEVDFNQRPEYSEILEYAMWASETEPFDPMEKSIHQFYGNLSPADKRKAFSMVKEFPLSGTHPVMTHVYQNQQGHTIIACKGALEGVLQLCGTSEEISATAHDKANAYARKGLRVLGVAKGNLQSSVLPENQTDISFEFMGIIAFLDPPDQHIRQVISDFHAAGVEVKMITGDFLETAVAIAKQTGIPTERILSGNELSELTDQDLQRRVGNTSIFVRIRPDGKLRIINALKASGQIVSMTGDGVNDAPALKSAHIGIAMGKRGTDVAKGAAGLILAKDDLSAMIDAIFMGRRINENLTKAIRYIISIHIPIILLVVLPIFMTWLPQMLFSPIHVIFLELIMGPTCSLIYENEPVSRAEIARPVSTQNSYLLVSSQLWVTLMQGLMITAGCLLAGSWTNHQGGSEVEVRSAVFTTLVLSNIFLTLANRSFTQTVISTIRRRNRLIPLISLVSLLLLAMILYIPALNSLFDVQAIPLAYSWIFLLAALFFSLWLEPFKGRARWVSG